ncbi:MAG: alpha-amylase family protein [Armatimonadota bacterium]|nr:alpha-amylase family protein [Armatimonadota bacterium]
MKARTPALVLCVSILLGACSAPLGAATTAEEVEEASSLESDLVTPHKPWGRDYVGGPVRALFFVYTGPYEGEWENPQTRVREVVELGQRFDLDADAVLFCGRGETWVFHGLQLGERRARRLLERSYDLYVIAGFPMEKLPAEFQYLILKQVAEGAGLLCCGPGAGEYMVPRREITPTPAFLTAGIPPLDDKAADELVSAYRLADGRGVRLKYGTQSLTPRPAFTLEAVATYDYWMLLVGRAALWAASREGDVTVDRVFGEQALTVDRSDPDLAGEVAIANASDRTVQARVSFEARRKSDGATTDLGEQAVSLPPGESTVLSVPLPPLRAGDYFVDAIVSSGDGVEAFGAGALTIESRFGIEEVTVDRSFVERGETIGGTVSLRGKLPDDSELTIRLRDCYDRIVRQRDVSPVAGQDEYSFQYRADDLWTNWMRVEALVLSGGEEVELKQASFSVPVRRQGQFNFVMWDAPMDVLGVYGWRQMQQVGYDVSLLGSMGAEPRAKPGTLQACNATVAPYSTRILDPKDENGYMEPVCWNDEPEVTEHVQSIVDGQRLLREHGIFVYSLGDEGVTKGCCVHPECIEAYRRYLADQYESIDRLNESWGSDYASFDEVDLLDRSDNMENAARETCPPRWYDRQAFARYNLAQYTARFGEAYRELDPLSKTGFEGTGGFGDDYDAILGNNDFYGPYPSIGDDIIRSAAPPELVNSNWMGYSKTGDALSDAAWRMVMKGKNSIWFWMWAGIGSFRGYLRPTLDLWPATEDLSEEMRPVRQGLGDLLMRSQVSHSGIGILYSLPSALSSQLGNSGEFIPAKTTHEIWTQLTYELGLDVRYITERMLADGVLDTDEFSVLLLPMTQALSPEQAELIRGFTEAGGTVIADVRPGIFDGHCKPVMPGLLDDLFGISRTGRGSASETALAVDDLWDGTEANLRLPKVRLDTEVEAATAEAAAFVEHAPVLLANSVGDGRTILLNFQLTSASDGEPGTAAARRLLQLLYDMAGARSAIEVASPSGQPLPVTETRVWSNGDALVFGLWRQMQNAWFNPKTGTLAGEPVAARVQLPSAMHLYDLRAGRYLGTVERVDTRLRWGRASFFMALPYEIPQPVVRLEPRDPAPGDALTASITMDLPGAAEERLAVWTEVIDPNGDSPLWGQQVAVLDGGRAQVRVQVAHNDLPGTWRIRATELFSGKSAEAGWEVR